MNTEALTGVMTAVLGQIGRLCERIAELEQRDEHRLAEIRMLREQLAKTGGAL